uniref:Synpr_0 protein n=1 Tax=Fopius arisanus TaxID=64838 RepID=A0A0C9R817_9HYME
MLVIVIGSVVCLYKPSGWRPSGKSFRAHESAYQSNDYNYRIDNSYGSPTGPSEHEDITTTTERNREATTPSDESQEDSQSNPALAIANSFAFNRPVYVYTGFPLQPAFTLFTLFISLVQ